LLRLLLRLLLRRLLRLVLRPVLSATAKSVASNVQSTRRFKSRMEFVRCLAALVALYPDEVRRKVAGRGGTIHSMLVRTGDPSKAEWLLNYTRQKQALTESEAERVPFGTASNEALHAALNKWFRGIVRLHQTSLRLKLKVFLLFKLMTHNAAAYRATTVQMSQTTVAHRVVHATDPWDADEWRLWCAGSTNRTAGFGARAALATKVSDWRAARGVRKTMKRRRSTKRTVFTANKGLALLKMMKRRRTKMQPMK